MIGPPHTVIPIPPRRERDLTVEIWITRVNLRDAQGSWEILRVRSG